MSGTVPPRPPMRSSAGREITSGRYFTSGQGVTPSPVFWPYVDARGVVRDAWGEPIVTPLDLLLDAYATDSPVRSPSTAEKAAHGAAERARRRWSS